MSSQSEERGTHWCKPGKIHRIGHQSEGNLNTVKKCAPVECGSQYYFQVRLNMILFRVLSVFQYSAQTQPLLESSIPLFFSQVEFPFLCTSMVS